MSAHEQSAIEQTVVRLQGATADIVLPSRTTFAAYIRAVEDQFGSLSKLAALQATPTDTLTAAPHVAIVVAHPNKLVPGVDEDTEALIALVKSMRCVPVLIPPCADFVLEKAHRSSAIAAMVRRFDGILGPGGDDIDTQIYGEARTSAVQPTLFLRDRFEADLAIAARSQKLFMFGICRSHQLWNAAFGGSLVQDVREEGRSVLTQDQEQLGIPADQPFIVRWPDGTLRFENRVHIAPNSWLSAVLGVESIVTNSYHHQAVDVPGKGMRVVGAVRDPEANKDTIEVTEDWNIMTTQFHPETMQNVPEAKQLFSMLGRRAHVFWILRALEREGAVTLAALLARLKTLPPGTLADDDLAWVTSELGPRL